jgi:pilus assembly protein CpaF
MELHERIGTTEHLSRDPFVDVKNRVQLALVDELGGQLFDVEDSGLAHEVVTNEIRLKLQEEHQLSREDRERLVQEIADDVFGYGALEPLLADPTISEVMVNGPDDIWIERDGRLSQTALRFTDEAQLRRVIAKIVGQVGRRIDESSPMVDARLPDGSRINAIIAPLSLSGPLLTIRRFSVERFNLEELIRIGTLSQASVTLLRHCVHAKLNVLVSGGTGAGKTTLLNALSVAIPDSERIVTIEDAAELQLRQRHTLRLESRPKNIEGEGEVTIRDLVRNALRMRPDRIVVGEVRGPEALDMLQAMNSGHEGSLSTIHANSPRDALNRLETMVLMAGYDVPLRAVRQHISSALDLIIQIERLDDGTRHVTYITEVQRMESDMIMLQNLYEFELQRIEAEHGVVGELRPTGLRPSFVRKFRHHGIELEPGLFGTAADAMYGPGGDEAANGSRNGARL